MDAGWQTQGRFDLGLVEQVSGRERGAQAQGTGGQQHVLHGGVDRCSGGARRCRSSFIEASDNPDGSLVKMVCQILDGAMLARVALRGDTGRRSTAPITRSYYLVEG